MHTFIHSSTHFLNHYGMQKTAWSFYNITPTQYKFGTTSKNMSEKNKLQNITYRMLLFVLKIDI